MSSSPEKEALMSLKDIEVQLSISELDIRQAIIQSLIDNKKNGTPALSRDANPEAVIDFVIDFLSRQEGVHESFRLSFLDYGGIAYSIRRSSEHKEFLEEAIIASGIDSSLNESIDGFAVNTSTAYVLMKAKEERVFVLSGGVASRYIRKFSKRNFGADTISKIYYGDEQAIRKRGLDFITGNLIHERTTMRESRSFTDQIKLGSNFRLCDAELFQEQLQRLGLCLQNSHAFMHATDDSLKINVPLKILDYDAIIDSIIGLGETKCHFVLNHFNPVSELEIPDNSLRDQLFDNLAKCIKTGNPEQNSRKLGVEIVGTDADGFISASSSKLVPKDAKYGPIEVSGPIKLSDVLSAIEERNQNPTSFVLKKYLLNSQLTYLNDEDEVELGLAFGNLEAVGLNASFMAENGSTYRTKF